MKKLFIVLGVGLLTCNLVVSANATLMDIGGGVLFEDITSQYWFKDLTYWENKTYDEQKAGIAELNDEGSGYTSALWGDWRMATYGDLILIGIAGFKDYVPQDGQNYGGRFDLLMYPFPEDLTVLAHRTMYITSTGLVSDEFVFDTATNATSAWVVADAMPVPEPTSMLLFGTGLASLVSFGIGKRKS